MFDRAEIDGRLAATRAAMRERGYTALLVYGDSRVIGSLYYLSGFYPDRAGWISTAPASTYLFAGAVLVIPLDGDPVLVLDRGLTLAQEPYTAEVVVGGFTAQGEGLSAATIGRILGASIGGTIGVESWDRFPAPLYIDLVSALPRAAFAHSRIVEELRLVKSEAEIEVIQDAARVGDAAHRRVVDVLRRHAGSITELELIREAEQVMRRGNPVYEDGCANSPCMIASGTDLAGLLLHAPLGTKRIDEGDIVHWDLCMRHRGYGIDTSRTRCVGEPTSAQADAYEASLEVFRSVLAAARPGALSSDLVSVARSVAQDGGHELWVGFLGHGTGIDAHERPDMGVEAIPLEDNMVLAIEPRLVADGGYLVGNEDVIVVTPSGGRSLNEFPKTPLALGEHAAQITTTPDAAALPPTSQRSA